MAKIATFYDHIRDMARQEHLFMEDALQRARELGVKAVEASANNVVGREDEIGQELAMADLEISTIPSYFDFGRDTDVKRQALPLLEAAQYLGAPKLLVIPGFFGGGGFPPGAGKPNPADAGLCVPAGRPGPGLRRFPDHGGLR